MIFEKASKILSPKKCAEAIGLSLSRLKSWRRRSAVCGLEDRSSCPKVISHQATVKELRILKNFIEDKSYSHFPITNLAIYAARIGKLYLSSGTWLRYAKQFNLKRTRGRKKYTKNKIGIRAKSPNEIWHIDVTVFKLSNNQKVFIQAIIDNYSRYIVAWEVFDKIDGKRTANLIRKAKEEVTSQRPSVICDLGVENINKNVEELDSINEIERVIAQVDINYSNSMIEAFFKTMKHRYLYFQEVNSIDGLKKKLKFYIDEYNTIIPHSAHKGSTPFEAFNGQNLRKVNLDLAEAFKRRQFERIAENKSQKSCKNCPVAA